MAHTLHVLCSSFKPENPRENASHSIWLIHADQCASPPKALSEWMKLHVQIQQTFSGFIIAFVLLLTFQTLLFYFHRRNFTLRFPPPKKIRKQQKTIMATTIKQTRKNGLAWAQACMGRQTPTWANISTLAGKPDSQKSGKIKDNRLQIRHFTAKHENMKTWISFLSCFFLFCCLSFICSWNFVPLGQRTPHEKGCCWKGKDDCITFCSLFLACFY